MTFTVNRFLYFERNRAFFTFILVCKNMQNVLINGSAQVKLLVINIAHVRFIHRFYTVERQNQPLKQTSREVTLHDGVASLPANKNYTQAREVEKGISLYRKHSFVCKPGLTPSSCMKYYCLSSYYIMCS